MNCYSSVFLYNSNFFEYANYPRSLVSSSAHCSSTSQIDAFLISILYSLSFLAIEITGGFGFGYDFFLIGSI